MTESSIPWSGIATGHAGPYDDNDWSDVWRKLFTLDRSVEGVLAGYGSALAVTNPAGLTIRVASGAGMVDGKFYENTGNIDFTIAAPGAGTSRYDLVVLRKTMADQVVRAAIVTGVAGAAPVPPALTQDPATIYEVKLALIQVTDIPVVTISDTRYYLRFADAKIAYRQGGSATIWSTAGVTGYIVGISVFQVGSVTITVGAGAFRATASVTFPVAYSYTPLVFVTSNTDDYLTAVTVNAADGFTVSACQKHETVGAKTITVYWLAIGPK